MIAAIAAILATRVRVDHSTYRISDDHSISFGDSEFRPVGVHIIGTPGNIRATISAGVKDLIVDLPADGHGWAPAITALEDAGASYLISISDPMPKAPSYFIEPSLYQVANLKDKTDIDVTWPGTDHALCLTQSTSVGSFPERQIIPAHAGRIEHTFSGLAEGVPYAVTMYPYSRELGITDFWEALDYRRDELLLDFRNNSFGPGFKGLINPLGPGVSWPDSFTDTVPDSVAFRREFASWIAQAYRVAQLCERSWNMGANSAHTPEDLSHFIPLWANGHGVGELWDPTQDVVARIGMTTSSRYWVDVRAVMRSSALRRYSRLVNTLRKKISRPIIQEWSGFGGPYEGDVELDGLLATSGADWVNDSAQPASSLERRGYSTWGIIDLTPDAWTQPSTLLNQLGSVGFQAAFINATKSDPAQAAKLVASLQFPRSLPLQKLFYPLYCDTTVKPGPMGKWWALPKPEIGSRLISLNWIDGFSSEKGGVRNTVLWSKGPSMTTTVRTQEGDDITVKNSAGEIVQQKTGSSVKVKLSTDPIRLEHRGAEPVDDNGFEAYLGLMKSMELRYGPRSDPDGRMAVAMKHAEDTTNRSPVEALREVRETAEYMSAQVAKFAWIEGARPIKGSDGTAVVEPKSRFHLSWLLDSRILHTTTASWSFDQSDKKPMRLWIAAKLRKEDVANLKGTVDDAPLAKLGDGVSGYGNGYLWYPAGQYNLLVGPHKLTLTLPTGGGALVDAIMVSADSFNPDGPNFPIQMILRQLENGPHPIRH